MEFRLLGSLEALDGDVSIPLRGARQRGLLALLLLRANESVPRDWLIDELWGERPPRSGATALHNQVARLRRALGPDRVLTRGDGYALRIEPGELDLDRFLELLGAAAGLKAEERSEHLRQALVLWHGTPLGGMFVGPFARTEIARLEELRLAALQDRIDAELELGRHADLVAELTAHVAVHPLSERLRGQLIIALYRCGRQAAALDVYRETRQLLAQGLGLEPSPALKELERAILQHDPGLFPATRPRSKPAPTLTRPVRRRLDYAVTGLLLLVAGGGTAFLALPSEPPERASALETATTASARPVQARPGKTAATNVPDAQPAKRKTAPDTSAQPRTKRPEPALARTTATAAVAQPAARVGTVKTTARAAATQPAQTVAKVELPARAAAAQPVQTVEVVKTAATAPAPTKTTPAKPKPFTISDDFSGATLDPLVWYSIGKENGAVFTHRDGRLEIEIAVDAQPDAQWNQVGGHYGTHCRFTGDFDARVDFELLAWPDASGAYAGLHLFFGKAFIARQSSAQWGDQYTAWVDPAGHGIPLPDSSGRLRMARVNGVVTTYLWHSNRWRTIVSGTSRSTSMMGLQLQANGDEFTRTPTRVAFDNFTISATQADCPPFADPRG